MSTKHTGVVYFSSVINPITFLIEKIYIRASERQEKKVYVRLPQEFASGVYVDLSEVEMLEQQLYRARTKAAEGLRPQKLEVTFADGTVGYVPLSRHTKRAVKATVVSGS